MFARVNFAKALLRSIGKENNVKILQRYPRHIIQQIFKSNQASVKEKEDEDKVDSLSNRLQTYKIDESSDLISDYDEDQDRHIRHQTSRTSFNNDNDQHDLWDDDSQSHRNSGPYNRYNRDRGDTHRYQSYRDRQQSYREPRHHGRYNSRNSFERRGDNRMPGFYSEMRKSDFGFNPRPVIKTNKEYEPFEKDFYEEAESVTNRSEEEEQNFLEEYGITSFGNNVKRPILTFEEAQFPGKLNSKLREEFDAPTPIQSVMWPQALSGRDVVGIAQTGSGKTLGFVLPGLVHILNQRKVQPGEGPVVLVLVPTRELCRQVETVARKYGYLLGVKAMSVYGGAGRHFQQHELTRGHQIVVATPGRLNDFLSSGCVTLDRCTFLVLDEADRMLDMGFEPQIREIISQIRTDRQTLMWSATWPKEIQNMAADFMNDCVQINVGSTDLTANKDIQQEIIVCEQHEKSNRLNALLDSISNSSNEEKVLIFVKTKRQADWLSNNLSRKGIKNACIHGDKSQNIRDFAIKNFKRGEVSVLVATDVCARGLDLNDITYVVNYDFPNTGEDYIHRIGRTGRAGRKGTSVSFMTFEDMGCAKQIVEILEQAEQPVPRELLQMMRTPKSNRKPHNNMMRRFSGYRPHTGRFREDFKRDHRHARAFPKLDDY